MMAAILKSAILDSAICTKKTSLMHSHSNWWWQPSWILLSWIHPFCTKKVHLFILTQLDDGSHLEICHLGFSHLHKKKLHSCTLTPLNDGNHLEFCHLGFSHFTQTLTQTSSIWLKLIHSDWTWWWQPSWILPCWIQTLPSWIQTPCYLFSYSLKNTLPPLWLCLRLIQSDYLNDGNHLQFFHLEFCHLGFRHFAH